MIHKDFCEQSVNRSENRAPEIMNENIVGEIHYWQEQTGITYYKSY